jgi:hypothetical protein
MSNSLNIKRAQQMLQFIGVTSEIMKRYKNTVEKQAAQKQAVAEKIPALLNIMVENDRIAEHQKDAIAKAAQDPVQCIEVMAALAKHRNSSEMQPVGTAVGQAKAANVKKRAIGGVVTNWDETEAGQEFRRALYGEM